MNLLIFRDPPLDGPTNMARDEHLLHATDVAPGALRIYEWSPATLSLGYFQSFSEVAKLESPANELAVVRRLTGGGAILHDREITYCLVLATSVAPANRSPAELYRLVHACWRDAISNDVMSPLDLAPEEFPLPSPRTGPFFCFAKPGRTDLLLAADKVLGSAQRRIPGRVMQHGSLILGPSVVSQGGTHLANPPRAMVERWIHGFVARLSKALDLGQEPADWSPERLADVSVRRERYLDPAFVQMR